jgi:hypothetical protein
MACRWVTFRSLVGGLLTVKPVALKARLAPPVRSLSVVAVRL